MQTIFPSLVTLQDTEYLIIWEQGMAGEMGKGGIKAGNKGWVCRSPTPEKTCEIRTAELGGRKHKLLNCATLTLPILREHMNHGEGWIFVTAVISASKRNNFSSDFRGVSRKSVSSAIRILNFSTILCKGRFLWGWTHKGTLENHLGDQTWPWWLRAPPWDVTSCILMALGAFKLVCELNIFNFEEEPWAIQKYQNAEAQLFTLDDKKNDALKFCALQSSGVLFLAVTKLQFHPQSWLTGSVWEGKWPSSMSLH